MLDNIFVLHHHLLNHTYRHGPYHEFKIADPKPRIIHKATVRDRVVHRAIYRALYWHFHQRFIPDSFSCRVAKGTHRALNRFRSLAYQASHNHTRTLWILKCDIKKFFASIDHAILISILERYIFDRDITGLLGKIIFSFNSGVTNTGLPLGNLTSQLFANVYLNELDQFIKHELKLKHYIRYADDFVILHHDRNYLLQILSVINSFLLEKLKLTLHPDKVFIKTLASGVDFLGWIHFPDHRVLRTATKRRMFRNLAVKKDNEATVASYLGMLRWGNGWGLKKQIQFLTNTNQRRQLL
ncbi:MAG: reverse transcriptase/maturase family protein [Patescibacteria group bacterium]